MAGAVADDFATTWTVHNPPYAILKWNIENFSFARNTLLSPKFLVNRTTRWYIEMHPHMTLDGEAFVVFRLKMDPDSAGRNDVMLKGEFTVHGPLRNQIFGKLFSDVHRDGFEFRVPKVCFSSRYYGYDVPEIHLVRCEMVISVEKEITRDWDPHLEKLSRDLHRLFLDSKFADFEIRMLRDAVGVHREFLSARSKELTEALLSSENRLFVNESSSIVRAVLVFFYTGDPNLVFNSVPVESFGRVAVVAAKLKMDQLVSLMTPVKISCKTSVMCKDFLYTWHLRNFSKLTYDASGSLRSEEFASDATTRWQLMLKKRSGTYGLHLKRVHPSSASQKADVEFVMYNNKSRYRVRKRQEFVFSRSEELGFSSFAEESYLNSKILAGDVLFIDCKMQFRLATESRFELQENLMDVCEDSTTLKYLKSLSLDLKALYKSGRGSDITLISGEKRLKAHSWILWATSPYFQEKLGHNSAQFLIVPMHTETLKDVLLYLYSGEVPNLNCETALNLYTACHLLCLIELGNVCRNFILRNLNVDIVLQVIAIAKELCDRGLEKAGVEFVCVRGNAKIIIDTQRWSDFRDSYREIAIRIYHKLASDWCNHVCFR